MILNGSEISIGDSIIMPIDISTLATTRSMIEKRDEDQEADLKRGLELARDEASESAPTAARRPALAYGSWPESFDEHREIAVSRT